jgi:DNA modification methylase
VTDATALADPVSVASLPTPYYRDDSVTIYHGDCREILPQLPKHDLLLTDPPYGIGEDGGAQRTRGSKRKNGPKLGWDSSRPLADVFDAMLGVTSSQVIWGGNYFADMLPASRGWLYWEKLMGGDFSDGELAWTSRDAVLKQFTKAKQTSERLHPTQKPLAVIRWCVSFFPEAETILDPFAGSCTTGVAAKLEGRKATLIELEERYCEIGANRLSQGVLF